MSKFKVGDNCFFDDDSGEVLEIRPASRGEKSFDVQVWWDNDVISWVWESDLLTQKEYDDFYRGIE
jgi:hypothetical protein